MVVTNETPLSTDTQKMTDRNCYLCGSRLCKQLVQKDGRIINQCSVCKHVYVTPTFTEEGFREALQKAYCNDETAFYREITEKERDRSFEATLFRKRLHRLFRLLGNRKGRILEIGCGAGFFLKTAVEEGWEAYGLEISETAYRYATRQLGLANIKQGLFLDTAMEGQTFDAIVIDNVLEHHIKPLEFLIEVRNRLNRGGCVLIDVPNDFNSLQRMVHRFLNYPPYWCAPTIHLSYFSLKTLCRLLNGAGFEPKIVRTELPVEFFLFLGIDYTKRKWARSFVRNFTKFTRTVIGKVKPLEFCCERLDQICTKLNVGRMLTAYATPTESKS